MLKMEEDISESYESVHEEMIEEYHGENEEDLSGLSHGSDSLLIELVEGYPHIYDNRNPEFKDVNKKEQAWNEIAAAMDWPVPECQNRWLRLREKFARETRAMDLDGSLGLPQKKRMFALYDKMSFLKSHVKRRRTYPKILTDPLQSITPKRINVNQVHIPTIYATNLDNRHQSVASIIANTSPSVSSSPKSVTPVKSTNQPAVVQIHQPALVQIIRPGQVSGEDSSKDDKSSVQLNGEQANTADALFGQFVAAELMKLPEIRRKQMKQKILQILYE